VLLEKKGIFARLKLVLMMEKHKEYSIPFSGLKQGKHQFDFKVDNTFFDSFGYREFNNADIALKLELNRMSTMLELEFRAQGTVNVDCDLTSEPFDQPIKGDMELVVKFGEVYNDEDDEILILPHGEHQINIAQLAYEMLVLAVPQKRVHPGVSDGTLKSEALKRLDELQPKETKIDEDKTDPRWDALKDLLTDK